MSVPLKDIEVAKNMVFQENHDRGLNHGNWYRGEHTNPNPTRARMVSQDAVRKYVLKGWEPKEKFINSNTQITAFGSCFAANISEWLAKRNFNVLNKSDRAKDAYVVSCGEGMVNSFVIRQQFEWVWENHVFEEELWHGYDAESFGYDPEIQRQTREIFDETDVFVLTFGLSEVWYDDVTKNVFWRTIPKNVYDPERHKFRVSSVEENRDNVEAIYKLIRKHRPDAKIIFTLSPIPLSATFRDVGCLSASSVSKAILRVALDDILRKYKDEGYLHYFPSYELMTDVFQYPYALDRKHLRKQPLEYAMTLFENTWCESEGHEPPSLLWAWAKACEAAGTLPRGLGQCIKEKDWVRLRRIRSKQFHNDTKLNAAYVKLADDILAYHNET